MGKKKKTKKIHIFESKNGENTWKNKSNGEMEIKGRRRKADKRIEDLEEYFIIKTDKYEYEAIDILPGKYLGEIRLTENKKERYVYASAEKYENGDYAIYIKPIIGGFEDGRKYKELTVINGEDIDMWLKIHNLNGDEHEVITLAEYNKAAKDILPGKYIGEVKITGRTFSSYCHSSIKKEDDGIYTFYIVREYDPGLYSKPIYYEIERFNEDEIKEWLERNGKDLKILDDIK